MNIHIKRLSEISAKSERLIIGLMSGTSMDGLDIALCRMRGTGTDTAVELLNFRTVAYTEPFRLQIQSVFSRRDADLQMVCLMNALIGRTHAQLINETLTTWNRLPAEIDLIASHGQTIFHAPARLHKIKNMPNATLQIGDGDHIAVGTGIITLSDFRQKHIAAGGEGAPLALYGDVLLFSKKGEERILLNMGGIANFTYLPADGDPSKVFSTDVGPGNTLMDQFVQKKFGVFFDENASIASRGTVHAALLHALLDHDFFKEQIPKTTGPELFNLDFLAHAREASKTEHLPDTDVLRTLCAFSAHGIILAMEQCFSEIEGAVVYASGGGIHNPLLMQELKSALKAFTFSTTDKLGISPDAKEAVLFALLANEAIAGEQAITEPAISMGKISLPG